MIWGPNPNLSTNPNQVKIYRATTDSLIPHPERLNYQLITTLGENINTWIDPDVIIGGDFNVNYYKIKLYDGSTLLNTSNIVNSWGCKFILS